MRSRATDPDVLTNRWLHEIPREDQDFGYRLLAELELDRVYGRSPMPVIRPDEQRVP